MSPTTRHLRAKVVSRRGRRPSETDGSTDEETPSGDELADDYLDGLGPDFTIEQATTMLFDAAAEACGVT